MEPFSAVVGTLVVCVMTVLMVGALYLGGGMPAVRRQGRRLLAIVLGLTLITLVVMPFLMRQVGLDAVTWFMVAASVLALAAVRHRRVTILSTPVTTATGRTITRRHAVALWIGLSVFFGLLAVVLAAVLPPPA